MTAPPHNDYYPNSFPEGETFTAFSHHSACRIVGVVSVRSGTKDKGYIVEFQTKEHAGWKLVAEQQGLDLFWCPGYYSCTHADLTHLRRTDGEHWKDFVEADEFACEQCDERLALQEATRRNEVLQKAVETIYKIHRTRRRTAFTRVVAATLSTWHTAAVKSTTQVGAWRVVKPRRNRKKSSKASKKPATGGHDRFHSASF